MNYNERDNRDSYGLSGGHTGHGERYSYSFEPEDIPKPKKRRTALWVTSILVCAMLLTAGGGVIGALIAFNNLTDIKAQADDPMQTNITAAITPFPEAAAPIASVNPNGDTLTTTKLFEGASPAVVAISTETTGRNVFGQIVNLPAAGSGFFVSEDGYVVTNNHVIDGATTITVITNDGTKYSASVIGSDSTTDLAVLKIDATGLSYLTFADSAELKVGEMVAAIGNPLGELANTFTVGYISGLDREINIDGIPRNMLQTDTAINSGNSGGPLISMTGRVVGVVSAKSTAQYAEGLGFAIPSNTVKEIIDQLISNGYVSGRAVMGVQISTKSNGYGSSYVYIEVVEKGSAAEKAGVLAGDIILFANDTRITGVSDLRAVLTVLKPGDKLTLDLQRGNSKASVTLTLDEYKPSAQIPESSFDAPDNGSNGRQEEIIDPWEYFFPNKGDDKQQRPAA